MEKRLKMNFQINCNFFQKDARYQLIRYEDERQLVSKKPMYRDNSYLICYEFIKIINIEIDQGTFVWLHMVPSRIMMSIEQNLNPRSTTSMKCGENAPRFSIQLHPAFCNNIKKHFGQSKVTQGPLFLKFNEKYNWGIR